MRPWIIAVATGVSICYYVCMIEMTPALKHAEIKPLKRAFSEWPLPTIEYPESDGEPLAETDFQRIPLVYAVQSLDNYFRERQDVFVSGNMFVYFREGDPSAVLAPDVFVVFDTVKHRRRTFKVWEEAGRTPSFVIEITSDKTALIDQGSKYGTYRYLGVEEYILFDPTRKHLDTWLMGYRLDDEGEYRPIEVNTAPDGNLFLHCQTLGLDLYTYSDSELRFHDPKTQTVLPDYDEQQTKIEAQRALIEQLQAKLRAAGLD